MVCACVRACTVRGQVIEEITDIYAFISATTKSPVLR